MPLMVQLGAGNIGRGLIAPFFNDNRYDIAFIDVNQPLINLLNEKDQYSISYQGSTLIRKVVNFSAINSVNNQDAVNKLLLNADYVSVSVGMMVLESIASTLANTIRFFNMNDYKKELTIFAFENSNRASSKLREMIVAELVEAELDYLNEYIKFYDTAIDGVVPDVANDTLDLISENYYEIVIESDEPLNLKGAKWVEDLESYIYRKLFIVNMGHASLAWYGHYHGFEDVVDVTTQPKAVTLFEEATNESLKLLMGMFPNQKKELKQYRENIQIRFTKHPLSDNVQRIGRNPRMKLHKNERFLKPITLYNECFSEMPSNLIEAACYGFAYLISLEKLNLENEQELYDLVVNVTEFNDNNEIVTHLVEGINKLKNREI